MRMYLSTSAAPAVSSLCSEDTMKVSRGPVGLPPAPPLRAEVARAVVEGKRRLSSDAWLCSTSWACLSACRVRGARLADRDLEPPMDLATSLGTSFVCR